MPDPFGLSHDPVTYSLEGNESKGLAGNKPLHKDPHQSATENHPEIWVQFFEHVAQHARLYRAMLGKNGNPWFAARMREHTIKLFLENERQWKQQVEPRQQIDPAMPQELPVMQLSHVLLGTIVWWLESEKSYTPRQMATWFHRFAFYGYLSARGMIRTSFCEAATRVPVSEPYQGGQASRKPIPLEQMEGESDQGGRRHDRGGTV